MKNMYTKTNHVVRVKGVNIERNNTWIKLLEYLDYNAYWNREMTKYIYLHECFKPVKDFVYTLYNGRIFGKMAEYAKQMDIQMKSASFTPSNPVTFMLSIYNFETALQ